MGNATLGYRLGQWWRARGTLLVAFAVVAGVGIFIGRWSRRVPEVEAKASAQAPGLTSAMAPAPRPDPPQQFDIKEDPTFHGGVPLRPMDRDIFAALADEHLQRLQLLDLLPDRPYKVRVVGSAAERRYGALTIDLDRDGKIDERWLLKGNEVSRDVPEDPASGGQPIHYTLTHGRWQPH
jgi:hypothetical protein